MSAIRGSILYKLPNSMIDYVANYLAHPHELERVSKYFSANRDNLFVNTWKMHLKRLQEGPDPIIGGLVKGIIQAYRQRGPTKADLVVKEISRIILKKAKMAASALSLPSMPLGWYDRRSLSELARATDIVNFFSNVAANSPLAKAAAPYLLYTIGLLPEEQQNILSLAMEISHWMTCNIAALRAVQANGIGDNESLRITRQFTHIPNLVGLLTGLRVIFYSHLPERGAGWSGWRNTWLRALPPDIQSCTELREAVLCRNMFEHIPLALLNCRRLEQINLGCNQITTLPFQIGQLRALHTLWLNDNDLESVPPALGALTALTKLSLNSNPRLAELPEEFWNLTSLQFLHLADTALTSLSSRIGSLTALRFLYVNQCKIKNIPAEMIKCVSLATLDLRSNPLEMSDEEIQAILPSLPPGDEAAKTGLLLSPRLEVQEEKKEAAPAEPAAKHSRINELGSSS